MWLVVIAKDEPDSGRTTIGSALLLERLIFERRTSMPKTIKYAIATLIVAASSLMPIAAQATMTAGW